MAPPQMSLVLFVEVEVLHPVNFVNIIHFKSVMKLLIYQNS